MRTITTASVSAAVLALCALGCRDGKKLNWGHGFRRSPSALAAMAFNAEDADERREGIIGLSRTRQGLREPHLKGYATVLRQDSDATVRSAAVQALGKAKDAKYLNDVVEALSDQAQIVRWDAALALAELRGPAAEKPLCEHAREDASAQVRAACAATLQHYPAQAVVRTLVFCLDDKELAVRHHARQSLVELTGIDMGDDSRAWRPLLDRPSALLQPPPQRRPWWDLFGLFRRKPKPPPSTQPGP